MKKQRARLLTGFELSEISVVDKAACPLADITSVQLVKRSESSVNEPELNSEALKAADIKPDEAGVLRKFLRFLLTPPRDEKAERKEKLDSLVGDLRKRLESEPDLSKWSPILADAADSAPYMMKTPDSVTHGGVVPPSGDKHEFADAGKDLDPQVDAGGEIQEKSDDMGQEATNAAIQDRDPTKHAEDAFTGGVNGNQISAPNYGDPKKKKADETTGLEKREFSQAERDSAADSGAAMSDGSYPIKSVQDLKNAIQAIGRSKNPAATRAHIKRRARALGHADLIPDDWKADEPDDLNKGLYDIDGFAQLVVGIDQYASDDADHALTNYALGKRLSALRDEAGQILIEMVQHELGDEKMASATVQELAKTVLDHLRNAKAETDALEKSGAKFSSATAASLRACKAAFSKAHGYFGKAADKYPDDDDLDNGMAHMSKGMGSFSKIDFEGRQVEGSDLEDKNPQSDADKPSKAAEPQDIAKLVAAEMSKAIEPLRGELDGVKGELQKSKDAAHQLEVENAGLKAKLEAFGQLPLPTKMKIGGLQPVLKGAADASIANRAGATQEPDLTIQPGDERQLIKTDMSTAFNKAFNLARREPVRITGNANTGGA